MVYTTSGLHLISLYNNTAIHHVFYTKSEHYTMANSYIFNTGKVQEVDIQFTYEKYFYSCHEYSAHDTNSGAAEYHVIDIVILLLRLPSLLVKLLILL